MTELLGFLAYNPTFTGGVFVAAKNVDGLPGAEIITGPGAGGGPHVRAFNATLSEVASVFAYNPSFTGGVTVAAGNLDGAGAAEIVTGPGPGGSPHVRGFTGTGAPTGTSFFAY